MINCPKCGDPLGELGDDGALVAVCPQCRFQYRAVMGEVRRWSSKRVTLERKTKSQAGRYERRNELRLERPDGELELIRFTTPGPDEAVELPRRDRALAVCTMRGEAIEEVVTVLNLTTRERFDIQQPGGKAATQADQAAAGVAVLVWLLAWWLTGLGFWGALLLGVAAAVLVILAGRTVMAPRVTLDEPAQAQISAQQDLLRRKRKLKNKLTALDQEAENRGRLTERLTALREKMAAVGRDVYGSRMDAVDRALGLLERQRALDERLRAEYRRAITILEIEHETARTTDALDGDVLGSTLAKLDELRAVEAENAAVRDALQANDEVSRLLA